MLSFLSLDRLGKMCNHHGSTDILQERVDVPAKHGSFLEIFA